MLTWYIIKRILNIFPVLIVVSIMVFSMIHLVPGDPVLLMVGQEAGQETIDMWREKLHLNKPIYVQYYIWVTKALRGDFGNSYKDNEPVTKMILDKLPATLILTISSAIIALLISIPAGIISAVKKNTVIDYLATLFAMVGISVPSFWLGMMLILFFSCYLQWLPSFGYINPFSDFLASLKHLILPSIALGMAMAGSVTRYTRSGMLEELSKDYLNTARAKGLPENVVIYKHAFKNALIQVITIVGLYFGWLLGGAIVVEQVFAWPGIGQLIVEAIFSRDYQVVQAVILFIALCFVIINLIVDIAYCLIDPRIRLK